jgi:voltage-gated potassium channel
MKFLKVLAKSDEESGSLGRHAVLLASLVSLLVALPLFRGVPGGGLRFSILLCLVLIASVYVNSRQRWTFIVALVVGLAAVSSVAINASTGSPIARIVSTSLGLGLLSLTTFMMLNTLIQAVDVSQDTIVGGICVYLMIGLGFALAYMLAITLEPTALIHAGHPIGEVSGDSSAQSAKILYFSFVTLTTLGFGDITPSGEMAQMLVTAEAIIGQLYIAIFIARLMSLYLRGDRDHRFDKASPRNE